jgi:hypothetical protein
LGQAVALGAAKRWHAHARANGIEKRATIALVDPSAAETCDILARRYPALRRTCELIPVDNAPSEAHPSTFAIVLGGSPDVIYACLSDPGANLAGALRVERDGADEAPILLPAIATLSELVPLLAAAGDIRIVRLPAAADSLELLHDDMREALARAVHERYLHERRNTAPSERPAGAPWDTLDEGLREANRRHADAMVEQLRAVWYDIEPRYDWDEPPAELDQRAAEAAAELEHDRWCRERRASAWRYGPIYDETARTHDLLVPWQELPEPARELDRALIRARPAILAEAGYRVRRARARDALARQLHADYVASRQASGETAPLGVAWDQLPDAARERSRAAIDEIAVKLVRAGMRAVPHTLATGSPATFSPSEVELLAISEHQRWLAERMAEGWTLGPRDDAAKSHPSLLPWSELSESEREKDRDVVRAIPALLLRAGYTLIRGPTSHAKLQASK